ncbi:unnamed protein product [Clavelina lepadiformis]|uniref:Secreted protein n=1 Tax=Clavelina lepadiformis TaxID=159417 RepID=A0ABP0GDH0_CLALP
MCELVGELVIILVHHSWVAKALSACPGHSGPSSWRLPDWVQSERLVSKSEVGCPHRHHRGLDQSQRTVKDETGDKVIFEGVWTGHFDLWTTSKTIRDSCSSSELF